MIYRTAVVFAVLCTTPASAADLTASPTSDARPGAKPTLVATSAPAARPTLSRADLPSLKRLDRAGVFAALGSFDDCGLSDAEFTSRALDLLDPKRVAGLAEARQASGMVQAFDAVFRACRGVRSAPAKTNVSAATQAAANDVLEHRFSFYGEQHQLPPSINWDANPGTAHWGHDLNRFTFLTPLTQTYLATRDTRYSRKAVELILDWIAKCDASRCFAGSPYVWGSYLNNAIHCQAWCANLATLVACEQVTPIELLRVLKSVHWTRRHFRPWARCCTTASKRPFRTAASRWRSTIPIRASSPTMPRSSPSSV